MKENTKHIEHILDTIEKMKRFDFSGNIPTDSEHPAVNAIALKVNEMATVLENTISLEKQSQEIQSSILNTLPANIAMINNMGGITLTNEGWDNFGKQNGVHPEFNWIGINYLETAERSKGPEREEGKKAAQGLRKILKGEIEHFAMEYPCHSPEKKRWFIVQVRPIDIRKEKGAVVMHIDITERKLFEERQLKLNDELELKVKERTLELTHLLEKERESNEFKRRFITMVSHEFRTPLSTILSSASLIEMYKESEQQESRLKHINRIASSVNNLTDILAGFLTIEEIENSDEKIQNTEINLPEFITNLVGELEGNVTIKDRRIIYSHSGEAIIEQPKKIVSSILLNLLSNAVKYSPKGKEILITSSIANNLVSLSVKDSGIGISEEDQKKLFGQFFRGANAEHIQGTGLGLNIVKMYVELIKGTVEFESKQDEGTTFTITFPKKYS